MRRFLSFSVAALLLLSAARPSQAGVVVLSQGSTVEGQTIGQWTGAWWNWAGGMTANPFADTTGASALTNQNGSVLFLAGNTGGIGTQRTFTVSAGEYVLIPLLNTLVLSADPGFTSTSDEAQSITDGLTSSYNLVAKLDGVTMSNTDLLLHRESTVFTANLVNGNPLTGTAGTYAGAASDGYWLMLAPLSGGQHTLEFGYTPKTIFIPGGSQVTDNISAVPEPASMTLFGLGLVGLFGYGRRRFAR